MPIEIKQTVQVDSFFSPHPSNHRVAARFATFSKGRRLKGLAFIIERCERDVGVSAAQAPGSFVSLAGSKAQDDGDICCRDKNLPRGKICLLVRIRQIIALPLDLPPSPRGEG